MQTLNEIVENCGQIDIGTSLSNGWKYASKNIGFYILGGILMVFITILIGLIPILGSLANALILGPAFIAGGIYVTWNISKNQGWNNFEDMFYGFKKLGPLVVCALISSVVMIIIVIVFFIGLIPDIIKLVQLSKGVDALDNQSEIRDLVLSLLNYKNLMLILGFFLTSLFISIIWIFKYHFVVVFNAESWPALEASRKVAMKNFLPIILTMFIMFIIIALSAIPLGLGLLFTLPWMIGVTFSMFEQATHCNASLDNESQDMGFNLEN